MYPDAGQRSGHDVRVARVGLEHVVEPGTRQRVGVEPCAVLGPDRAPHVDAGLARELEQRSDDDEAHAADDGGPARTVLGRSGRRCVMFKHRRHGADSTSAHYRIGLADEL